MSALGNPAEMPRLLTSSRALFVLELLWANENRDSPPAERAALVED